MSTQAEKDRLAAKEQQKLVQASKPPPVNSSPPAPAWVSAIDTVKPFVFGGFAGIVATTCIQPLDCIKVRIQLTGEGQKGGERGSLFKTGGQILRNEGFLAMYTGYSAAVLRQAVYGTARLGLFRTFSDLLQTDAHSPLPFWQKAVCGLASGALGSVIGNPADLTLVRMQADGQLPADKRRNYRGVGNALVRIVREEGIMTLWRGSLPTVYRAMAMNCGMLSTNDQAKEILRQYWGDGTVTSLAASAVSGVVAATATLPFDMIKTRVQRMSPRADGSMPYSGFFDCFRQIVKTEGVLALWKGWGTFCVRVAPHAVITLVIIDEINGRYGFWRKKYAQ